MSSPAEKPWPSFAGDPAGKKKSKWKHGDRQSRRGSQQSARDKRAERHSKWGRDMEKRVSGVLSGMVEEGLIEDFTYHEPNSEEDFEGKDFSVRKSVEGNLVERSFAIAISFKSAQRSMQKHLDLPQWHFPINITDKTMVRKVLSLF